MRVEILGENSGDGIVIGDNREDFVWHDRAGGIILHRPSKHHYQLKTDTLQRIPSFTRYSSLAPRDSTD